MPKKLNTVKMPSPASPARDSYHHGDLRGALLRVGEEVLAERGPAGFSLREVARRAGVSPAAPAHHFGDARGLLTAIAASGFRRLDQALAAAAEGAAGRKVEALAAAYLSFARANAALFSLMWMQDLLDGTDPGYVAAGRSAFNSFERAASGRDVPVATGPHVPDAHVLAAWAMAHGYARLALDGALAPVPDDMAAAVFRHLPGPPGDPGGA